MKLLVIGSGGREHALAWKLAQSPRIQKIFVAPGNAGTGADPDLQNIALTEISDLISFARQEDIVYTVVGPEAPLAAGIVDRFRSAGLTIFGPTQAAAQLESSKAFAKHFMQRHAIPTARAQVFIDTRAAHAYLESAVMPIVVKADGLAGGKGVVVAPNRDEAHRAIDKLTRGSDRNTLVLEEYLEGEEVSFIVMVDGQHILPLATSQDHKRLYDNEQGPNTGGMGAYSPAPLITPELHARIMREIMLPTVLGMAQDGVPYSGFLYAGLMIDKENHARVLEFNCRLGDPEAQAILMRLKSDLVDLLEYATEGKLNAVEAEWDRRAALTVVLAAPGYPEEPQTGGTIYNLPPNGENHHIFHAGTQACDGAIIVSGGRVLSVTALGDNIKQARAHAYELADKINFAGLQMRRDIGARALKNKRGLPE